MLMNVDFKSIWVKFCSISLAFPRLRGISAVPTSESQGVAGYISKTASISIYLLLGS